MDDQASLNAEYAKFAAMVREVGRHVDGPTIIIGNVVVPVGQMIRDAAVSLKGTDDE